MSRILEAQQLLESDLLVELLSEYHHNQYEAWLNTEGREQQMEVHARGRAVMDLGKFIENKCKGIVNGHAD